MSTVKIKTEPTTAATTTTAAAAAAAAVDVQVKLEPSLSTADIKLEQHSSDIDTKVESDSEADIKSENDEDDDTDQSQFTITAKKQRTFICEYSGCSCSFKKSTHLRMHQHEHRLQTELFMYGKTYTLARQSLNDRWPCPIPGCTTYKSVGVIRSHIHTTHAETMRIEQQQQQQYQQPPSLQKTWSTLYFQDVDGFYIYDVRCGYQNTIGVFICYECRLVPECLLTHLQRKHGYDEKSIDKSTLPESALNASADPNRNQHSSNPLLAAAIRQPHWQHHQDIVKGWLCAASDCCYCGYTVDHKSHHKRIIHHGERIATVPALVLRLAYAKISSCYFLITRIDQASSAVTVSGNRMNRHKFDYSHNELNTQDENEDDDKRDETTESSIQKQQWKCEYHNCGLVFNANNQLRTHWREHKLETVVTVRGTPFTLTRQSVDDRWPCPIPECGATHTKIRTTHMHIKNIHHTLVKQKRAKSEDGGDKNQHTPIIKRAKRAVHSLIVDDFYIGGIRYGYHTTTGVFICHECKLVPECLLTHLQQKHGYDEKSIASAFLPESAVNTQSDPNGNQHTTNSHLAASIGEPSHQLHQDIVRGWLCPISDCGYCCFTKKLVDDHRYTKHRGEKLSTVPALVLRLLYGKARISYFFIIRLDTITSNVKPGDSTSQYNGKCHVDDGDELVLSDYGDGDELVLSDMGDDDETTI